MLTSFEKKPGLNSISYATTVKFRNACFAIHYRRFFLIRTYILTHCNASLKKTCFSMYNFLRIGNLYSVGGSMVSRLERFG